MSKDPRVEELKKKAIEMEQLALDFKFPSPPKTPSKRSRRRGR